MLDLLAILITLSAIFKWYKGDFIAALRREALPTRDGVLAYIRHVATGERKRDLETASGYSVEFFEYDWHVNRAAP